MEKDSHVADFSGSKGDIIHLPRRTPIPKRTQRSELRRLTPDAPDLRFAPYNALGAVHSIGNGFIAHPLNIGNGEVIDVQSILADNVTSQFLFNSEPGFTTSDYVLHKDFDSLQETITKTKKVTSGFSLNLGLFSIGQHTTYNKTFNSDIKTDNTHRWANVNLYHYAKRIGIEKTDASLQSIAYRNISDAFLYSLYTFPISNYIKEKGFLVVTDFFVGGRVSVLIDYSSTNRSNIQGKDRDIDLKINGAFGWGADSKGAKLAKDAVKNTSLNVGYYGKNTSGTTQIRNDEDLRAKIDVYGGKNSGKIPNYVVDLKTTTVDVSDWYESLSDPKNHKFIDVAEGGLVGIDKFMLETNFKHRVSMTLSGRLPEKRTLDIPYVEIRNVSGDLLSSGGGWELDGITAAGTILHTRQGDDIILINKDFRERLNDDSSESDDDLRERYKKDTKNLVDKLEKIFQCEVKSNEYNYNRVLDRSEFNDVGLYVRLNFSFDRDKVYKYKNPKTNMWYIYDPEGMAAFSYYDDPNDDDDDTYITDMYGLTDWVESLQTKKISIKTIATAYRIIGL